MSREPVIGGDVGNWGAVLNDFLSVSHNSDGTQKSLPYIPILNDVVVVPTGVAATDTANLQAAVNTLTGAANPASNTRIPTGRLLLGGGTFVVNADILIQSVEGFHLQGAGKDTTYIKATGAGFTTAVLNVDGSAYSTYEGFTIQGDGTEQVTNAIAQQWTAGAGRSTTMNTWRNISIRNLKCVNGFNALGHNQNDGTTLQDMYIVGSQVAGSWSASGNWQRGVLLGDATSANNLDHVLLNVNCTFWYYGVFGNGPNFWAFGSEPFGNFADYAGQSPHGISITGVESQSSSRFYEVTGGGSAICPLAIRDVNVIGANLNGDGKVINATAANVGPLSIDNFTCTEAGAIILVGGFATHWASIVASNVCMQTAVGSAFVINASPGTIDVTNYGQMNSSNQIIAMTRHWTNNSGTAVLVGGTVTVSDTNITATSKIKLSVYTPGGTVGAPYVSVKTAATGFTITSTSGADTSTVYYEIDAYT